jgi:single-strand DNA-binding protein
MSSRGLNVCTLAGNLAADPEIRTIPLRDGTSTQVADLTIYVDRIPSRKENDSFTVDITVWEGSAAWRKLGYIKKGSLIIASGAIDASPYVRKVDSQARAGLKLKATDIFLDSSPRVEESDPQTEASLEEQTPVQEEAPKTRRRSSKKEELAATVS